MCTFDLALYTYISGWTSVPNSRSRSIGDVAHTGTPTTKKDNDKPALRPIRHIEYQMATVDNLKKWYDYYGLDLEVCTDQNTDVLGLVLDYLKPNHKIIKKLCIKIIYWLIYSFVFIRI